jgi:phage repressor protein C with HTH and peptisase S24 domain
MDGLETDTALIRELCRWADKRPAQIARAANVANTTINRPFKGTATTRISQPTIDKLKAAFPKFPGFALESDLPLDDGDRAYVEVSVLPSYAGAGGGGSGEGDRTVAKLSRHLIEDELRGRASDFELIDVRGDSMAPDFHHGDQILIDRRDRDPRQPGPFALWDDDGYVVKLVERIPQKRGWYRIFSVNDRYSAYEVEETETTIMGRPVWFARRL